MHAERNRPYRARLRRVTDHGPARGHEGGLLGRSEGAARLSEPSPGSKSAGHTRCHIADEPLGPLCAWQPFVSGGAVAGRSRSCTGTGDPTTHGDIANIGKSENKPGQKSLLCQAIMDRFFVPAYAFQSRRAQRRSRMPVGHRAAARSVLEGREHDGILDADGQHGSPHHKPTHRSGRPKARTHSKVKRRCRHF